MPKLPLLALVIFCTGCGSGVPDPTESDVETYVKDRVGDQLFNSMMALEGGPEVDILRAAGNYEPPTVDNPARPVSATDE